MTQRPHPPESPASAKGEARKRARDETTTPMDKFRSLARRLVNVPRQKLIEEQERYDKGKANRTKPAKS
jgi:hypothetical protein